MKNKKLLGIALGTLALGAIGSIAMQSFAQTAATPAPAAAVSQDQNVDQKDQNGNDLETKDDATDVSVSGQTTEKSDQDSNEQGESIHDTDGGSNED